MPRTCLMGGAAKSAPDLPTFRVPASMLRAAAAVALETPTTLDGDAAPAAEHVHLCVSVAMVNDRAIDARGLAYALASFAAALGDQENHANHADPSIGERAHEHALRALELAVKLLRRCGAPVLAG